MKNVFILLMGLFSILHYSQIQEHQLSELEWTVSFKKNHVIFECSKGCNYSYLSFDSDRILFLTENAIINLEKNPEAADDSNFLVQYSKNGNQINLEGIKGVEWKKLTVTSNLNSKYVINQIGEIKKIIL